MLKNKATALGLFFTFGFVSLLFFQNCGGDFRSVGNQSLSSTYDIKDDSGVKTEQVDIIQESDNASNGNSNVYDGSNNTHLNFVAGSKESCEDSVLNRLGINLSCVQGGGCGLSCGIPGANCASANPQHYGLCVEMDPQDNIVALSQGSVELETTSSNMRYNFVAGDKQTCEASVKNKFGTGYTCVRGGGCGISCGIPNSSCISANPQHYGLCVESDQNGNILKLSTGSVKIESQTAPSSQLYNFVAGSKADCENSIKSRFGTTYSCTKGGGCGLSCGVPSSTCASANPQHWGACIRK